MSSSQTTQHVTQTICNTIWGHQLSFHPFVQGDHPINFASLWPTKQILIETCKDANLGLAPYELVKLVLASNNPKSLDALLEEQVIRINQHFSPGNVTLAHLACTLGLPDIVNVLFSRGSANNGLWSQKDDEDHIPHDVCFNQRIKAALPHRSIFSRSKIHHGQVLKPEDKDTIFQLAKNSDDFYRTVVKLQMYQFDVNREYNNEGDLLIHVAIKGGLAQLPLLFVLVNIFKADVSLKNRSGLTPLCVAAKQGEEKIAEILVCVFGADVNAYSHEDLKTPLHHAVLGNHPRVVSMLLRRGADANREDKNSCVPAFMARKNRYLECRQIINQHLRERNERLAQEAANGTLVVSKLYASDVGVVTSSGCTLVMIAAMNNQEATLKELVKMNGCPLDFRQMKGCELLDDSLTSSIISQVTAPSHEKNDMFTQTFKTAVHFAAERGHTKCLRILLEAKAHPALSDASGLIPLHYACENAHLECVQAIVTLGGKLGLSGLKSALAIAETNDLGEIAAVLRDANLRRQDQFITPLLFEVAHSGNKDLLFRCLENGDDVNPTNEAEDWPLLLAAGFGYHDLVTQLHELGGEVTRRHKKTQSTALHGAARGGHCDVVRYLLQFCICSDGSTPSNPLPAGANDDETPPYLEINARNAAGATPLELAASQGHLEVVRVLLAHGASTTLPDSTNRLINCNAFAGTQFLIESNRKERLKNIIYALKKRVSLEQFQKIWQCPSDFNLHTQAGENILMVAAEFASPEVFSFLIKSASSCKPGMLVSSEECLPPPSSLFHNSSHSEDSFSERSLPKDYMTRHSADECIERVNSASHEMDSDERERERHTALPSVFRGNSPNRRQVVTERSSRRNPVRQLSRPPSTVYQRRSTVLTAYNNSSTTTSSGDDESDVIVERQVAARLPNGLAIHRNGGGAGAGAASNDEHVNSEAESGPENEFARIVSYRNPKDGQTALHRAANGCQSQNVVLLLQADESLANRQDNMGNTALHLACIKVHKPTIKALLGYKKDCVDTTLRNNNQQLPEEGCVRTSIRKLVCKERQKQVGNGLPDPPKWKNNPPSNWPSVERAPPNGPLPHEDIHDGLPQIPEMSSLPSTMSELTASQFQARMQELKMEYTNLHPKNPEPITTEQPHNH